MEIINVEDFIGNQNLSLSSQLVCHIYQPDFATNLRAKFYLAAIASAAFVAIVVTLAVQTNLDV